MAGINQAYKLIQAKKEVNQAMQSFLKEAEKEVIKESDDAFKKQGWTDTTFQRWKSRKRSSRTGGYIQDQFRPILIKTGKLRNSIKILFRGKLGFTFGTNVPYASYHNEGTSKLPKRQFIGISNRLRDLLITKLENKIKNIFK
jgi:phage gpG-like protein